MNSNKLSLITKNIKQLDGEEWRPVVGSSERYWVSNKGRVCSTIYHKPRILEQFLNNSGYYRVSLSLEANNAKHYLVHRLVAEAFCDNDDPEEKMTVHHRNHNKSDNSSSNLQYLSRADNIKESILFYSQREKTDGKK